MGPYQVFLSYAHGAGDRTPGRVASLVEELERALKTVSAAEFTVFIDHVGLRAGDDYRARLQDAVSSSVVFAPIITNSYLESSFCRYEYDIFARAATKRDRARPSRNLNSPGIIPVRFEVIAADALESDARRFYPTVEALQYLDFAHLSPRDEGFKLRVFDLARRIVEETEDLTGEQLRSEGSNEARFKKALADASSAIISGTTHSNLVDYLRDALDMMRQAHGKDGFWESISIVFPSDDVLNHMDDKVRDAYPDVHRGNAMRVRIATRSLQRVTRFLRRNASSRRWHVFRTDFLPLINGALLELRDGSTQIQLSLPCPGRLVDERLFVHFRSQDPEQQPFVAGLSATFHRICSKACEQKEVLIVGYPRSDTRLEFQPTGTKFRSEVLPSVAGEISSSGAEEWLPCVLALLFKRTPGNTTPILSVRSEELHTREIGTLSNISGYVNETDCDDSPPYSEQSTPLHRDSFLHALRRELNEEVGLDHDWPNIFEPRPASFYYVDHENLYFGVFPVELDMPLERIDSTVQLQEVTFSRLLKVRLCQVLDKTIALIDQLRDDESALMKDAQSLCANLILHRQPELGDALHEAVTKGDIELMCLREQLERERKQLVEYYYSRAGGRHELRGLAGLQYRQFFELLVPAYAAIGVEGAAEYDQWLATPAAAKAVDCLHDAYQTPQGIRGLRVDG